jgi:beta-glucanase (GH16 family)
MYTFDGMEIDAILGLPEENVAEVYAETENGSMTVFVVFDKTDSEYVEPEMIFYDEFDGDGLDTEKWAISPNWDRQGRSTWDGDLVSIKDGYLSLGFVRDEELGNKKVKDNVHPKNWLRSGSVRTMKRDHINTLFENNFGYYEARIKFPQVRGMWGAFWLMSPTLKDKASAAVGTEIDIIESIHNERGAYNAAIHWGGYGGGHKSRSSKATPVDIFDGEFHVFALEWSPTEYIFYVDDVEYWRFDGEINQNPNYVKLSAEGAEWAGDLPEDFTEGEMLVDYVRIYNQPKHREAKITED